MRYIACIYITLLFTILNISHAQDNTATPEPIPDPMPLVDEGGDDILNVVLIGLGIEDMSYVGLTDTLIVVSINRTLGQVSMVSIPRDLYAYVPGFGMNKLNTAYYYGETEDVEGGGIGLLTETLRYNLGLEIDHYALVNFATMGDLIDAVGGIEITVDCTIEDWRLKSPELDKHVEENWEMVIMRAGLHHMDGDKVLWYVRSRRTSSDLDRGRRQQDVLRALWRKLRSEEVLSNLPAVWSEFTQTVETDLTLTDALAMLPLAMNIETSDMAYYTFSPRREVSRFISPAGQEVLLPDREGVASLMQQVVHPTEANATFERPTVGIVNVTGIWTMGHVAADRIELEGFETTLLDEWSGPREFNKIVDNTNGANPDALAALRRVLRVTEEGVETLDDPTAEYDYKVFLGSDYTYWTCTRDVIQPTAVPDAP